MKRQQATIFGFAMLLAGGLVSACGTEPGNSQLYCPELGYSVHPDECPDPPVVCSVDWTADSDAVLQLKCQPPPPARCLQPGGGGFAIVVDGDARPDGLCEAFANSADYTDPTEGVTCDPAGTDCDSDGLSDVAEIFYNEVEVGGFVVNGSSYQTAFFDANTDGTGDNDGDEVAAGTDPTDPNDPYVGDDDPAYTGGDVFSYVSAINFTDGSCCFNLNDGPGIDNGVAGLLNTIGPLLGQLGVGDLDLSPSGLSALITELVEDGTIMLIAEHVDFPNAADTGFEIGQSGTLGVKLYLGELSGEDEMTDQEILDDYADRVAGDGAFVIEDALQDEGGTDLILNAVLAPNLAENDQLRIDDQALPITIDVAGLAGDDEPEEGDILGVILDILGDDPLTITIERANIVGEIEEQTTANVAGGDNDGNVGIASTQAVGLDVGGAIALELLLDILNPAIAECFNPEDVPTSDIFVLDQTDDTQDSERGPSQRGTLECTLADTIADLTINNEGLGGLCEDIGEFAGIVCGPTLDSILGSQLDVDTDGDGVYDGISIGIRLALSGAADTTSAPAGDGE